jgi:pantoate--beta-alanine ligase
MVIFKNAKQISDFLLRNKRNQRSIGFVPTMGALHDGHISLINKSVIQNDLTVCSIFVNPTQFNDPEDFKKYPITIENDIYLLESSGCDLLFLPSFSEIYPEGTKKLRTYDLGYLETILEGEFRPGHFQGVCQVVHRLLEIVLPDTIYLGQKDYQQCKVIKKMLELTKFIDAINIEVVPTMRESGGLAMSSRNKRLSANARSVAAEISKVLMNIQANIKPSDLNDLIHTSVVQLESFGFKVDYVRIADAETLNSVYNWDGKQRIVGLVAAFIEGYFCFAVIILLIYVLGKGFNELKSNFEKINLNVNIVIK